VQFKIEKMIYGGDGLARLPADEHGSGKAAFIPFVLEGERVEAEITEQARSFVRAKLSHVIEPSPHRADPRCPYFARCGGCQYQHSDYEHQLQVKAAVLKENLRRIAKLELKVELELHGSPAWNYRNRTRLKVQTSPEFAIGYYRFNSHELLAVEQCPISSPLINETIRLLWTLRDSAEPLQGLQEIELFADDQDKSLLVEAHCSPETDSRSATRILRAVKALSPAIAGVVAFAGSERAVPRRIASEGATELTCRVDDLSFRVSAGSFFQVNRFLTGELVRLVTAGQSGKAALDLYAGVGLFASVLKREFEHVIAVESSPTSYADLLYNSPPNGKAVKSMTEQFLVKAASKVKPDLVVVDPPRSGLGEKVVSAILDLGPARIVYVSCDPATLARDLQGLLGAGYQIKRAHLVDLFPQTYHLESIFHLQR
jgi:23S rRNA (uracil1939-C5)-methyltransferase